MKLTKLIVALLIVQLSAAVANADEGMWLLNMIGKNYKQMKAQGFKLKPEDIYNVNKSSLKDAIVMFGGYCTGEIVSDKGLLFTNHHCGYTSIQQHSSLAHDFLKDGFWAQSYNEEIPTPGLYVSILQEIVDVTDDVIGNLKNPRNSTESLAEINNNIEEIQEKYSKQYSEDYHRLEVKPFFEGNAYYLMIFLDYKDVRMVGTPPDAIGKFGGDTDNWMWPRHTGDFSVFRVYTDPNGNPAEYSKNNIPLKPKHYLPVSIKGYKEGDFAMVMGFPGTTQRYSTSYEIENDTLQNSYRAKIRGIRLDILHADMEANDDIRIKYATKFAHSSNYWKNAIESNKSLKALNITAEKQAQEKAFENWFRADRQRNEQYGNTLKDIQKSCERSRDNNKRFLYFNECIFQGMELMEHAYNIFVFLAVPGEQTREEFINSCHNFYKDYSLSTDYKSTLAMAKLYTEDIEEEFHPEFLKDKNIDSAVNYLFTSIFTTKEGFDKFAENPTFEVFSSDPLGIAISNVLNVYSQLYYEYKENKDNLSIARTLYVKGSNEMNGSDLIYPDANFTERLTFGTIQNYRPKDGVQMNFFTTTDGILEKEIPNDYEFDVPAKLKNLILNKDFGEYTDKDGTMHVCFLSNNDITGGNSGSPVLDAKGNLIGLAFDGNSEAMCSDWYFNTKLQRCINVDIRYVLFIIEKYGNCPRIINELKIVKK